MADAFRPGLSPDIVRRLLGVTLPSGLAAYRLHTGAPGEAGMDNLAQETTAAAYASVALTSDGIVNTSVVSFEGFAAVCRPWIFTVWRDDGGLVGAGVTDCPDDVGPRDIVRFQPGQLVVSVATFR